MATEEGKQPTVKLISYIQICHLIQKGTAAHVVQRYDNYLWVCGKYPYDRVQNKNQRSCCGAGGSEGILIAEI